PLPVPGVLVRGALGDASPREAQRAAADAFNFHDPAVAGLLRSGRRLLPELSTAPFDLGGIECPVLLVCGARVRAVPHARARFAISRLPPTLVELIEDCGRFPQPEATGRLLELLLPFPA